MLEKKQNNIYFCSVLCISISKCMRKSIFIAFAFCLFLHSNAMSVNGLTEESFVQWRDTLYVRMADSVFKDGAIEFNIDIYRPNSDWNNDHFLGDVDFYFKFSDKAFDGSLAPSFVSGSVHEKLDVNTLGRKNLLFLDKGYHANRLLVSLRTDHAGGDKLDIPLKGWVTLCRLRVPMNDPDRNPGLLWDTATGLMTAGGDPILVRKMGSVDKNPKGTVKAGNIIVTPQWACEGSDVLLYVEDVTTSGSDLKLTWSDSTRRVKKEIGTFNAPATGTSSRNYTYEVRGIGDTLVIKNAPGILDSMVFSCVLTDASVAGKFVPGECVVYLRDSVYGYLASTTPGVDFGMSDATDTIKKCPGAAAPVKFYFFGPSEDEVYNPNEISMLTVHCKRQDEALNVYDTTFQVNVVDLTSSGNFVHYPSEFPAGNNINFLYEFELGLNNVGKYWIESIETDACSNGMAYCKYDTIYVQEVEGDIAYNLRAVSMGVGETINLDTARDNKPYTIDLKHKPSPIGGTLLNRNKVYSYKAAAIAGKDTVVYTYKKEGCNMKAERMIEVVEKYYLTMKVLLEGPYLGVDVKGRDTMNCYYAEQESYGFYMFPRTNTLQLKSPYDDKCILNGVQKMTDITTDGFVCDWIYIKLRGVIQKDGMDFPGLNYIDSTSALVLHDGRVCGLDGESLNFKNLGGKKVFVEVKHRNHLKVISSKALNLPTKIPDNLVIDFTDANSVFYGNQSLKIILGRGCLMAGDLNNDGFISIGDQNLIMENDGKIQYLYDVNHDNFIVPQDNVFMINNDGEYSRVP